MAFEIPILSKWQYVGSDGGRGAIHTVCGLGEDEVITHSYINEKTSAHSWMGTRSEFLTLFKPAPKQGSWFKK